MTAGMHKGFSFWRLLWGNLGVRPLRSALSVIAIALQVFLILLIVGLTTGALSDWAERAEGVGADIMVQPPNSSIFFGLSSAVMQESVGELVAKLPGVAGVSPVLFVVDSRNLGVVYGIDYPSFAGLSSGFKFLAGGPFQGPDQAMADDLVAASRHLKVGDTTTLIGRPFKISGIVEHGKGARFFIPLATAQDIAGAEKRVSMFYVRSTGKTELTRAEIVKLLPDYRIRSMAEYLTLMTSTNLPELKPFIRSFVGLGASISFLVVLLTMHTMVLERTREIGILKALGSSRLNILWIILGEALLMAALGVVVGLAGTYSTTAILRHTSPTLQIKIHAFWVLRAIIIAVVATTVGAAFPAYRAAQADPVDALAYE